MAPQVRGGRQQWAEAYHAQARESWSLFELLSRAGVSPIHPLHALQMATENLAKAYRARDPAADLSKVTTSHVGFKSFMAAFLRSQQVAGFRRGHPLRSWDSHARDLERLARAVERLAPAVDRADHPANVEYPWWDGRAVRSPLDYAFEEVNLRTPDGLELLKYVKLALDCF